MMVYGERIEPLRVGIEEGRHLIDEGSRASRAGFVHALLNSPRKEGDFGIFPTEFYGDIGVRYSAAYAGGRSNDFLNESQMHFLRQRYGPRTGEGEREEGLFFRGERGKGRGVQSFVQHVRHRRAHIGKMSLIAGIQCFCFSIENNDFDGGGTHVKAYMGEFTRAGHGTSCPGKNGRTCGTFRAGAGIPPCRSAGMKGTESRWRVRPG